jgi:hypothetical protein
MPSNFFASECSPCAKLTPLRGCSRRVLEASQLVAGMFWAARRAFLERYKEPADRTAHSSRTASKGKHWADGRSPVRFVFRSQVGQGGANSAKPGYRFSAQARRRPARKCLWSVGGTCAFSAVAGP